MTHSGAVQKAILSARECLNQGDRKGYDRWKRSLPLVMFMATFDPNTGAKGKNPENRWRCQSACRLNGLVMLDVDHVAAPRALFHGMPAHLFDDGAEQQVMLVHVTPSGQGLRIVFQASQRIGNLADNQQAMALKLGVTADEACKDASRGSFVPMADDILYVDNRIFDFHNADYDKTFGDFYRGGRSAASVSEKAPVAAAAEASVEQNYPDDYEGTPYTVLLDRWTRHAGGAPATGKRHFECVKLAADFRYICDNQPDRLLAVLRKCDWIQTWLESEHCDREVEDICRDVCAKQLWFRLPKRLEGVLAAGTAGAPGGTGGAGHPGRQDGAAAQAYHTSFYGRVQPLLGPPYDDVVALSGPANALPAIFGAAGMLCTLLTRTWYRHFDGLPHRMNPQVYIIGAPAAGKSIIDRLNKEPPTRWAATLSGATRRR